MVFMGTDKLGFYNNKADSSDCVRDSDKIKKNRRLEEKGKKMEGGKRKCKRNSRERSGELTGAGNENENI